MRTTLIRQAKHHPAPLEPGVDRGGVEAERFADLDGRESRPVELDGLVDLLIRHVGCFVERDAASSEMARNGRTVQVQVVGELSHGLTGLVAADDVVDLRWSELTGMTRNCCEHRFSGWLIRDFEQFLQF